MSVGVFGWVSLDLSSLRLIWFISPGESGNQCNLIEDVVFLSASCFWGECRDCVVEVNWGFIP